MPYGEESAYAAQAALKKKSPAYKKSSGFKMKSSPKKFLGKLLNPAELLPGGLGKMAGNLPGSEQEKEVVMHEMIHMTDMKVGKLAYDDNFIKWNGVEYPRAKGKILYNNEWVPEGSKDFPWEKMPWE